MFNVSYRKVGGIHFFKAGRVFVSFGLSRRYRPIGQPVPMAAPCSMATLAGMAS